MRGGTGSDSFRLSAYTSDLPTETTVILDFEQGLDRIVIGVYNEWDFVFDPDNIIQFGNDVLIGSDDGGYYARVVDQVAEDFDASDFSVYIYSEFLF